MLVTASVVQEETSFLIVNESLVLAILIEFLEPITVCMENITNICS